MAETPAPGAHPLFDPALPASPSLLFYLHAERLAPTTRWGTKAPLANVRVDNNRLACAILAIAFWHLRESGLVRLELGQELKVLEVRTRLRIARASPGDDGRCDGIEGGLLQVLTPGTMPTLTPAWESMPQVVRSLALKSYRLGQIARANPDRFPAPPGASDQVPDPPPGTVFEVVTSWYGPEVVGPSRVPIAWAEREGLAKGYLAVESAHRNPLLALFLGKTTQVPQRERIAALDPVFAELSARWQAFKSSEAALADQLEHEVDQGIRSRSPKGDTA